jgi:DNA-binding MarR family transcriptional regulator
VTNAIWLDDREQRAWRSFTGAMSRLKAALARELQRDSGLSGPDYDVLAKLSEAPGQRLRAYELGQATGWEKSRLSHHLSRMEQRGLVAREQCAGSRFFDVVLTEHGKATIEGAAPTHVGHVRDWFVDALTPDQLDALAAACDAISARLGQASTCGEAAESCQGADEADAADDDGHPAGACD